ncbi:MAG: acyl-CoA reductase [Clostridia bacterium]|nr:acyl-CoA reductase [Clostridia bacterium]
MILAHGKIYDTDHTAEILENLVDDTNRTLAEKRIGAEEVVAAAQTVAERIASGAYDDIINGFDFDGIDEYVSKAVGMLKRDILLLNLKAQLPHLCELPEIDSYLSPVGVLFHIAAGNIDVLPAYSVLSGLICGNVNVLKLPSQDDGITVKILEEFIKILPEAADFIYVFDTPSSDVLSMIKMAEAADRIVVWGGDEAVSAVRRLAPPSVGIVEWGHRISFAYVGAGYNDRPDELRGLAEHIIKTSQMLCSSCQRIYVDSSDPGAADGFCRDFLPYLQAARDAHPLRDIGAAAEATLLKYAAGIEGSLSGEEKSGERKYYGRGCSLTAKDDTELEISGFFGNCDVSALPLSKLFSVLRRKKGYLQTACIIADEETAKKAEDIMVRAGVNRVTTPAKMSDTFIGEAHDGSFELQNYVRVINKCRE